MEVGARGLVARTRVLFPVRDSAGVHSVRGVHGTLVRPTRIVVQVPADAVGGTVRLISPGTKPSGGVKIAVLRPPAPPAAGDSTALGGTGVWIWYLSATNGGDLSSIGQQAALYGVKTLYIKSGDGTNPWAQFAPATVTALKSEGLHVCAWQYVYGNDPVGEAAVGIASGQAGADCLIIDAEGEYEGRYAQAQQYIQALRAALGPSYPIGLAGFPYVDYHPAYPYSVFLGPGGAQYSLPQMYWKAIGTTVDDVFAHTWPLNRVYPAKIYPLGQLYDNPAATDIARFRQLAIAYGATGISWWDWQEATPTGFAALDTLFAPALPPATATAYPTLHSGSKGDLVVWAQEHLSASNPALAIDGSYGPATTAAVTAIQTANAIPATGILDATTWPALLAQPATPPVWTAKTAPKAAADHVARTPGASGRNGPASAFLPAVRDEIPPGPPTLR
jgi:hypothetical protein